MPISLAPGVTYCLAGGRVIFMNLDSGRFSALPGRHEDAFHVFTTSQDAGLLAASTADYLTAKNFCVESDETCLRAPRIPLPTISLLDHGAADEKPPLNLCLAVLAAQLRAKMALRLMPFRKALDRLSRAKLSVGADNQDQDAYARLEAAMVRTNILLPPSDRCLTRSMAFMSLSFARNLAPDLVIGVRSNPFRAHAWVQSTGRVVHDDLRQARLFTPIFKL
jgi:hypothetical protein